MLLFIYVSLPLLETRMHISRLGSPKIKHTRRARLHIATQRAKKILPVLLLRMIRMLEAIQPWGMRVVVLA